MERAYLFIARHMRRMPPLALLVGAVLPVLRTCTLASIHLVSRQVLGWDVVFRNRNRRFLQGSAMVEQE